MQDIAFTKQAQSKKHLLGVRSDSSEVDANITTELLQDFT